MRFLLLNTDYRSFLEQMYRRHPGLAKAPYDHQVRARNATFFGVGDAYARALRVRGHDAHDIHMNNTAMQGAWAREHGPQGLHRRLQSRRLRLRRGIVPWLDRGPDHDSLVEVLASQVAHHRPDVVINHDPGWVSPDVLRAIVGRETVLVGQHAATALPSPRYTAYDLIVSSWPPTIAALRAQSVRSEHLGLGFDPLVVNSIDRAQPRIPVSFVGSFTEVHQGRVELVEDLCREADGVQVFAPSVAILSKTSPIRACYHGPAFGLDMFQVLARSEITINHHGLPEPHANNMRLFEATGVGALLLTDDKPDLDQYFNVGTEVLTYESPSECVATIRDLSPIKRDEIAARGQRRTLEAHTWDRRIGELLTLLG